jgi:tRNA(fMet)-specific endonuclease VapC
VYLLDTNACIAFLTKRSLRLVAALEARRTDEVCLCSVVKAELVYGAYRSQFPEKNLATLGLFFEQFVSFPFDDRCLQAYGRIRADLSRLGQPIGPMALMIAAIALSNDLILVTHNTREFGRVQGLILEDWQVEV